MGTDQARIADPDCAELVAYRHTLLGKFDQRVLATRAGRIVLAILLGAVLIIPSIQFMVKIQETTPTPWRAGGERHRTALGRWLPTAKLITTPKPDEHPYGYGHWFPTPPMVLISLAPLSKLGYVGAGVVWAALKVVAILLAMVILIKGLGRENFAVPLGVMLATAVFSIRPIIGDITHGNLNIFMMLWLAIAWGLYVRKRDFWAGIFVALAVATKITPALVLVYFLYKRAWRVCVGAGVGLVLFFVLIPGLVLGFGTNFDYLGEWFHMMVAPFALDGYVTYSIKNQSLIGTVMRLLANARVLSFDFMSTDELIAAGSDEDMIRPTAALGRMLLKPALALPVLVWLAWFCRTRSPWRRDPRLLLEFGMVLLAMLLLSERTWKHHATTLPIVFLGVWYVLTCTHFSDRFRAWYVAGLIAQFVMLVGSTQGILSDEAADLALDAGIFCWGLLLCLIQTGILLTATNRQTPPKPI
jgi:hypothetical protein